MSQDRLSFATPAQSLFLEQQYEAFKKDPGSVDPSWQHFFEGFELGVETKKEPVISQEGGIASLINAYRYHGHLLAHINPLDEKKGMVEELKLSNFGFSEGDLNKSYPTHGLLKTNQASLKEILAVLQETYSSSMGVEYMGRIDHAFEKWLQEKLEPKRGQANFTADEKKKIFNSLNHSELFETFLHTKYTGQKRFSLEGAESVIPMVQLMLEKGGELGIENFVFGLAHRGRLNFLSNIMQKSHAQIFCEFEKTYKPHETEGVSDVKYHKGYHSEITLPSGKKIEIFLSANPSHLESVNPIVQGQALARQEKGASKVLPVQVHGDAAIAGQGVVYETLQHSQVEGYSTGGTIHIVLNNHLGFTALPKESRSTPYCTDIAKTFGSPVFHVNAEDPESCVHALLLALEIRNKYHKDVFIDLSCYRKYGHNESDEPMFTQPKQYQIVKSRETIRKIYSDKLLSEGVLDTSMIQKEEDLFKTHLQKELDIKAKPQAVYLGPAWKGLKCFPSEDEVLACYQTALSEKSLRSIAEKICHIPESFSLHRKLERLVEERKAMMDDKIDWGMAEHLAYGSLLHEGISIRISGQDSQRGTFSHRQAVWFDQKNFTPYCPLGSCQEKGSKIEIYNSILSEEAAMGFEIGYAMARPQSLVIWEAQFGDFANGAQNMIDEYVMSSEQKWGQACGLTLLLPHGYEGQGPDHSSARLERFLQMAADLNTFIAYPSLPGQFFHLLRRQVLAPFRKPLIVMTPKFLLRHPPCRSSIKEFSEGSFETVLDDPEGDKTAKALVLCTGKVYYSLLEEKAKRGWNSLALIRIEQLYPLERKKLSDILSRYSQAKALFWVQEEPQNAGAWDYMNSAVEEKLDYVGSPRAASPAMGTPAAYQARMQGIYEMLEHKLKRVI